MFLLPNGHRFSAPRKGINIFPINWRMKNRIDINLREVVNILIIYHILDS